MTTVLPPLSVQALFAAVLAGKARPFNGADHTYFDAPEGSVILEAEDASWMYIVSSDFRVEAHGLDAEDDPVAFLAIDGRWERA